MENNDEVIKEHIPEVLPTEKEQSKIDLLMADFLIYLRDSENAFIFEIVIEYSIKDPAEVGMQITGGNKYITYKEYVWKQMITFGDDNTVFCEFVKVEKVGD